MNRTAFRSTTQATGWQEGVVVGAGSVGAVLHGSAERHDIHLTHEDFFLPLDSAVPSAAALASRLDDVRRLVLSGDIDAAADLVERVARASGVHRDIMPVDPFVPIGVLCVRIPGGQREGSYERFGDFRTGGIGMRWVTAAGTSCSLRIVPDCDRGELVLSLHSAEPIEVSLEIGMGDDDSTHFGNAPVPDYRERVEATATADSSGLGLVVHPLALPLSDSRPQEAWVTVTANAPAQLDPVRDGAATLVLGAGCDSTLVIRCGVERASALPPIPPSLLSTRRRREQLFDACTLDLRSGVTEDVTTEDLLRRARSGDPDATRAAVEFAFAAGRSAIISSIGELPPNLVGVWQGSWAPAWSGAYTVNGNVQLGSMAALYNTGTPELLLSLFRLYNRFTVDFEENARRLFDAPGYALPTHLSNHGKANHHSTEYPHIFWYGGGAWALRAAYDYFSVTGDRAFVSEVAWPFAQKVMEFIKAVPCDVAGSSHLVPSYSPENTPRGHPNPLTLDATADLALFRDAARIAAAFARVVGDETKVDAWRRFRSTLPEYRVADDQTLAEWAWPNVPEQLAHRHASQLYPYWYDDGDDATDDAIDDAARASVRAKTAWRAEAPFGPPGHQEMAFGLSSIGIAAARLGDARSAHQCAVWLSRDHFEANAISRHDRGSIFNVDACGALPAVVAEMLVSTSPGCVSLLPALPDEWPEGRATGLTGRGGLIVDSLEWNTDRVAAVLRLRAGSEATRSSDSVQVTLPRAASHDGGPVMKRHFVRLDEAPKVLVLAGSQLHIGDVAPTSPL